MLPPPPKPYVLTPQPFAVDPIHVAGIVGNSISLHVGKLWFPELEILFLLRTPRRLEYDDDKNMRLRRNLNLIGKAGTGKSKNSLIFLREAIGAVDYAAEASEKAGHPTYLCIDGGGVSWEKLRGGAIEGRLVLSKLHDVDFLYASELFSFLGSGERMNNRMDVLNSAIEDGNITIDQMGLMNVSDEEKEKFTYRCAATQHSGGGVFYNPKQGTIRYKVAASFICCTRPFSPEQIKILTPSGFRSRLVESEWCPTEEQLDEFYDGKRFKSYDKSAMEKLREYNNYAWACTFKQVNAPPSEMLSELGSYFFGIYRGMREEMGVPISDLIGERDHVDTAQLLTAFAIARLLRDRRAAGLPPGEIADVNYLDQDVERVKEFRQILINERRMLAMVRSTGDSLLDRLAKNLGDYMKTVRKWGRGVWLDQCAIERASLLHFIMGNNKTSRNTSYNHIAKLVKSGLLEIKEDGLHPTRGALNRAGIVILDDEVDHEASSTEADREVPGHDDGAHLEEEATQ